MKIGQTSILEIICVPLKLFGIKDVRQPYIYEHVFTPLLVATITLGNFQLIAFIVTFILHVIVKEIILDRVQHGYFNKENIIERLYGMLIMGMFYIFF